MTPGSVTALARRQPFALFLRIVTGDGRVLLRCVSPVGKVAYDDAESIEQISQTQQQLDFGKVCAVKDDKLKTYNLTIEADMLFHPDTTQLPEVVDLIRRTTHCADYMEKVLLKMDERMETFRDDLLEEPQRA